MPVAPNTRKPFQAMITLTIPIGSPGISSYYTLPTDKEAVIEFVTLHVPILAKPLFAPPGFKRKETSVIAYLLITLDGKEIRHRLALVRANNDLDGTNQFDDYAGTWKVKLYADAGSNIGLFLGRQPQDINQDEIFMTLAGYLV